MRTLATAALASIAMAWPALVGAGHLDGLYQAAADIEPIRGNTARGRILISSRYGKVLIAADFRGLTPGPYGIHFHQIGDCSSPDGMSAGTHFEPPPLGALGNVVADAKGNAEFRMETTVMEIERGKPDTLIGRSVVLHSPAYDPNRPGARIACGVLIATHP